MAEPTRKVAEIFMEAGSAFKTLADLTMELEDPSVNEDTKVTQKGEKKAGKSSGRGRGRGRGRGKAVPDKKFKKKYLKKKDTGIDTLPGSPSGSGEPGRIEKPLAITFNTVDAPESEIDTEGLQDLSNLTIEPDSVDFPLDSVH